MDEARNEIVVYQPDGALRLEVRLEAETVWLNQQQLCALFGVVKSNVSYHLKNIFQEGELVPESTAQRIRTVRQEATRKVERLQKYYNLNVFIYTSSELDESTTCAKKAQVQSPVRQVALDRQQRICFY